LTLGYDPVTGVRLARERESIEHRLSLAERVDLHNMLAWHSAALGDLETVVGSVEKILGDIAPNQALNLALSLSGWLVWGLAMTGRWDEVAPAVAKASRRWEDAGRPSSGFALHGFLAALEVGWARGDDALISQCQTLISGISEQFPPGNIFRRLGAWLKPDVGAIATQAVADWRPYTGRLHLVERSLSLCVDFRYQIPRETLQTLLAWVEPHDQRLLAAQVRRALGVLHGDAEALGVALAYYRAIGARPLVARTEFELGTLTVQDDLRDAGVASLEALGDLGYLRRRATLRS